MTLPDLYSLRQRLRFRPSRDIDVLLVCRLDSWARSVTDLLTTLQELEHLGVSWPNIGRRILGEKKRT